MYDVENLACQFYLIFSKLQQKEWFLTSKHRINFETVWKKKVFFTLFRNHKVNRQMKASLAVAEKKMLYFLTFIYIYN